MREERPGSVRQRSLSFIPVIHAIIITHLNVRLCPMFYFFLDSLSRSPSVLCLALSLWCVWLSHLCTLSPRLCVLWPALCVDFALLCPCVPSAPTHTLCMGAYSPALRPCLSPCFFGVLFPPKISGLILGAYTGGGVKNRPCKMGACTRAFIKNPGKIGIEKAGNFSSNHSEVFPG